MRDGATWCQMALMRYSKVAFEEVVSRVLSGEIALETADPVPAWPGGREAGAGSVSVFMLRSFPGAVFTFGVVDHRMLLSGGYSPLLREFCFKHRRDYFDWTAKAVDADALMSGFNVFLKAVKSGADSDADGFMWICGVEAAELFDSLARVHGLFPRSGEVLH